MVEAYNYTVSILNRERIEPSNWEPNDRVAERDGDVISRLRRFWTVANAMGVSGVWILVDSIDEAPNIRSAKQIFDCICSVLLSQRVLEFRDDDSKQVFCFKIFMTRPEEIEGMLQEHEFRFDRVKSQIVEWKRSDLHSALSRRLAHFSSNAVLNFDEICEPSAAGTHDRLLDEAKLRPRTLFRMANEIFAEFQRRSAPGSFLLDKTAIDSGIAAGLQSVVG